MTAGKGFIALAALIFAKWRAWPALGACFLFGLLDAIAIRCRALAARHRPRCRCRPSRLCLLMTVILLAGVIGTPSAARAGVPT
jgi:simple sugar transport system permease protein